MKNNTVFALSLAGALALGAAARPAFATDQKDEKASTSSNTTKVHGHHGAKARHGDNTGVNKRERDSDQLTAGQQSNKKSDEKLTAEIRRSITDDKTLSFSARNVKVITRSGKVTLKGPVGSVEEKRAIEQKAEHLAGAGAVTSELEIKQQ